LSSKCHVVGIDINPGESPRASKAPRFSAVGLSIDGEVVYKAERVSLRALIARIWRLRPSMVAVDNVYEVARDLKDLIRLLKLLPEDVKLVQVTGPPRASRPLVEVALDYGLKLPSKLTPIQAAWAAAKLALMGAGCEVRVFEPETRIVISRARSYGAGGMSLERFKRDARSLISYATKELCEELKSKGLDFDLFTRTSRMGLERSLIVVYAPREQLKEVLRSIEERGVKVKVYSPPSEEVHFVERETVPQAKRGRYLIVGVDPGMVTGLAVLTLEGRPLMVVSRRAMDRLSISRLIMEHGYPLIIASDVVPPPMLVVKLASMLNAVLHVPSTSLSVDEKRKLVAEAEEAYGIKVEDSHQRDALAAAIKAFMHYRNKLEQAEAHVKSSGLRVPIEEVKAMVIRGHSIQEAIKRLSEPKGEGQLRPIVDVNVEKLKAEIKALQEKISKREEYIEKLEAERRRLLARVEELSQRASKLEEELERERSEQVKKLKEEGEVRKLEAKLESLRSVLAKTEADLTSLSSEVSKLRDAFLACLRGELKPLKPVNALTPSGVAEAAERYNIGRGDLVLIKDATVANKEAAEELVKLRVAGIISVSSISWEAKEVFIKGEMPFIEGWMKVLWVDEFPLIEAQALDQALREAQSRVKEEKAKLLRSALTRVLEEYRRERSASLGG